MGKGNLFWGKFWLYRMGEGSPEVLKLNKTESFLFQAKYAV